MIRKMKTFLQLNFCASESEVPTEQENYNQFKTRMLLCGDEYKELTTKYGEECNPTYSLNTTLFRYVATEKRPSQDCSGTE